MAKRILVTGGSGFIGSRLVSGWLHDGHSVVILSRSPERVRQRWTGVEAVADFRDLQGPFDWLVNLAGAGIADQRWSQARKRELYSSRVGLTEQLVSWAESSDQHFDVVLTGSAIGYYGSWSDDCAEACCHEESPAGTDFAARLCGDWEAAAAPLARRCQRLVQLRTGVVLGARGGMLGRLWLPFGFGLGGVIGSGHQILSWIHLEDYVSAVNALLSGELLISGAVNMTAPGAVDNRTFTRTLAAALHRPALLPMPECAARMVFGEMGDLLLKGQRVEPLRLLTEGFRFGFADLESALAAIVAER